MDSGVLVFGKLQDGTCAGWLRLIGAKAPVFEAGSELVVADSLESARETGVFAFGGYRANGKPADDQ